MHSFGVPKIELNMLNTISCFFFSPLEHISERFDLCRCSHNRFAKELLSLISKTLTEGVIHFPRLYKLS